MKVQTQVGDEPPRIVMTNAPEMSVELAYAGWRYRNPGKTLRQPVKLLGLVPSFVACPADPNAPGGEI